MQLGMIGLGRMGGNMAQRLIAHGHQCVGFDPDAQARQRLDGLGGIACDSVESVVKRLSAPRVVWLMLPVKEVDAALDQLKPLLEKGDVVVDGGNSLWRDSVRRAAQWASAGIAYMDVGTSGGVRGLERGYCLMAGGSPQGFTLIEPLLLALAPGAEAAPPTPGRALGGTAEQGYMHCGPAGAGHFVKMIHNAIEYGIMAAYAEGFNLLQQAGQGGEGSAANNNAIPPSHPKYYGYDFNLPEIAELWRRGSVIGSWLLDLTAQALQQQPELQGYTGRVSDSGEGRWAMGAALDLGAPAPVLSAALFSRFESRESATFAMQMLSAMREQFGGHVEAAATDD
ncbi:decarboxylating 6-phosphogluconate dehydrogenase [Achromobacter sp. F4_2707]|uniref:phosphogluconate dehydrogenase (NAD(+)-dependent, decarboxylating) n=1 Tax=Achromobacter sp. F4_2707 TaxID=3114286 RepID=UPI0039C74724